MLNEEGWENKDSWQPLPIPNDPAEVGLLPNPYLTQTQMETENLTIISMCICANAPLVRMIMIQLSMMTMEKLL